MNYKRILQQIRDVIAWHLALECAVTKPATLTIVEAEQHPTAPHTERTASVSLDPSSGYAQDANLGAAVPLDGQPLTLEEHAEMQDDEARTL